MSAPFNPATIANFFLRKAASEQAPITHMKLQKLVYIAHGWCLGIYGKPLINKPVQAWKYGPVIPYLYNLLKHYGNASIAKAVPEPLFDSEIDRETEDLLSAVWSVYGKHTALQLSESTHLPGTPWSEAVDRNGKVVQNAIIDEESIAAYYNNAFEELKAQIEEPEETCPT